jgi:5-methylcytosine-specific restriction protein A
MWPNCAACGAPGTDVDHIRAHRGDEELRLDPGNLRTLCRACHSRKTVGVDGGFGRG